MKNYLNSQVDNELITAKPPVINPEDKSLPRGINRTLAQLRDDKSPFLYSYLNKIDPQNHPSPLCPLCKTDMHNTKHLFSCIYIKTHLKPLDLWNKPVAVAELLQQRKDALAGSWRRSGDFDLMEVEVMVKNNNTTCLSCHKQSLHSLSRMHGGTW